MRLQPIVTACLLAAMTLLLSGFWLRSGEPLGRDEFAFTTQARAVATGATPLFFHLQDEHWLQPLAVYANAAVRAAGGGDIAGRIVSSVAAAISVALVFLIAFSITNRLWVGAVAAVALFATPAQVTLSLLGTDAILPSAFVLLWLWSLLQFLKRDSMALLATAAAALGGCVYAHPAGPLTALFLWILTLIVARRRNRARLAMATLVFAMAWLPALAWFVRHPDTYPDTFGRWFILKAHLRNPMDGLRAFMNPNTLGIRASAYWGFWDPSWLFFRTGTAPSPLQMLTAPLIAFGIHWCVKHAERNTAALLMGSALIVPLAGATFGVTHYVADAAAALPLLAIVSALGALHIVTLILRRPPSVP